MKKQILLTILTTFSLMASEINLNTCKSCHGQNFEKKALGHSKIVNKMSEDQIQVALLGYKDKTYGSTLKAVMYGQIKNINKKDIPKIAKQIKID